MTESVTKFLAFGKHRVKIYRRQEPNGEAEESCPVSCLLSTPEHEEKINRTWVVHWNNFWYKGLEEAVQDWEISCVIRQKGQNPDD